MEELIIASLVKAAEEFVMAKEKMDRLRERILNLYARSCKTSFLDASEKENKKEIGCSSPD